MRDAGITDVAVVLGSVWPEKVREYYGDGHRLGMNLQYIDQGDPKGLAHAVNLAKNFVGNEKFVMYLGDNILKGGIAKHAHTFASSKADAMVLLSNFSKLLYLDRFGIAKFNKEGKLEALVEKPKNPPSQFALVGVYFLTPSIFDSISRLKPSHRGELEITDAIQSLIANGRDVQHGFVEGWWKDTGTPEDILEANRLVLDEKVQSDIKGTVEKGASIQGRVRIDNAACVRTGAIIRGPVFIGSSSVIDSATYVGPYTSIGSDCQISSCELENSIVMDKCVINTRQRIADSLIGSGTEIRGHNESLPKAYRFVLGEKSQLTL